MRQIPLTLVSGFRGSGKSSVLKQLKKSRYRLSFLEDDGEKDIFAEIEEASQIAGADCIVVECTANLEPYFIAEHLTEGDEENPPLKGARIDTLVTVVDASSIFKDLFGRAELLDRDLAFDEDDDRFVPELLIEQIEFADVVILNKTDLVTPDRADQLVALLSRLNPRARVLRAEHGRVAPAEILSTDRFDLEETDEGAGWLWELSGDFRESEGAFGVSSFTFVDRRPFHPARFGQFLRDINIKGLVRAKGSVWIASRHEEIGVWSLAGRASLLTYGGRWFASTPLSEWPRDERERMEIMQDWVAPFGDRRQEIAFIGLEMSEAEVRSRLEKCLLTSNEMNGAPDSWRGLEDPLPDWQNDSASPAR